MSLAQTKNPQDLLAELDRIRTTVLALTEQRDQARLETERALLQIEEGTAGETGGAFFRGLVLRLASALDVYVAFVAEFAGGPGRVRTLSLAIDGRLVDNIEYDLEGTPCFEVARGAMCHHHVRVAEDFPQDTMLAELGARGYLGAPLINHRGEVLGHLAIMDRRPITARDREFRIFRIFADRARVELERRRAEDALASTQRALEEEVRLRSWANERMKRQLALLYEANRTVSRNPGREALAEQLAQVLKPYLPVDRLAIFVATGDGSRLALYAVQKSSQQGLLQPGQSYPHEGTACGWVFQHRLTAVVQERQELAGRFPVTCDVASSEQVESMVALPLLLEERCIGVLVLFAAAKDAYPEADVELLREIAPVVAVGLDHCMASDEIARLQQRLEAHNLYLREEIAEVHNFQDIVGQSAAMRALREQIRRVAESDASVLVYGETGTGKELVARALHNGSRRARAHLVKVNCGALAPCLVESELFGHVRGAFTGALQAREGKFALADGGTLFLDEVGELAPELQVKLLRVLQEREFEPVGSDRTQKTDVRVIAATNRVLGEEVRLGRFRADLYYRLSVVNLNVPPLRHRREDIPLLAAHFLARHAKRVKGVTGESIDRLVSYDWPGNVRELQNVIERAAVLNRGEVLHLGPGLMPVEDAEPPAAVAVAGEPSSGAEPAGADPSDGDWSQLTLEEAQRRHILGALARTGGTIEGPRGAAVALGLHPNTLRSRISKLGIR